MIDTTRTLALDRGKQTCRIGHLPQRRVDDTAGSLPFIAEPGPRESERMVVGTYLIQHRRKRHEDVWVSVIAIGQARQLARSIRVQPQRLELNGSTVCRLLLDFDPGGHRACGLTIRIRTTVHRDSRRNRL